LFETGGYKKLIRALHEQVESMEGDL